MINKRFDTLIQDLQGIKMSAEEKNDVYNRALSVIAKIESAEVLSYGAAAKADAEAGVYAGVQSGSVKSIFVNTWNSYILQKKFVPSLAMVAILFFTGGASLAAEKSLPGDFLYPFKVNVNEQVKGLAAVTPEDKAQYALDIADQRLKEATILSSRGQLSEATGLLLQQQITKQASEVKNQVASLVETNNLKSAQSVTVNFESALKAHELILEQISTNQASTSPDLSHIASILETVKSELATTTVARTDLQAKEFTADAYSREKVEGRLAGVKTEFFDVQNLVNTSVSSNSISTTTASTSALYLSEANKLIAAASLSINEAVYPPALTYLQSADQTLSDIAALIEADLNTDNDTVDLKSVVNAAIAGAIPTLTLPTDSATSTQNLLGTSTSATFTASSTVDISDSSTSTATTTASSTSASSV